ncbi:MAG: type secretion system protein [Clostridiales bacterium]|nr:type secretion system protein [Clostridiales bacterium]
MNLLALINPFEAGYDTRGHFCKAGDGIRCIIDELTARLVSEQSNLIAEVEAGKKPKELLEAEIVSVLDDIEEAKKYKREDVIKEAMNSIFGYGPIEPYIQDKMVSDVIINAPDTVFIKKKGKKFKIPVSFGDNERLLNFCKKIVAICGGRINEDEAQTVVTDRERNLRIVVSIPPVTVGSPSITIRNQGTGYSLEELVGQKMLDENTEAYLVERVKERKTIVIAGKGGSGKTTLLGALIHKVPYEERGLLIQETNEINVKHPDIVSQLVKITDGFGGKEYTLFDLTRFGLLMSLDRFFIGEMKDREAFDFFNAVFTGHTGSMATVHSNSAGETIDRLVLLMKRADTDLSGEYLKQLLAGSLDIVIYMKDYKIHEIKEVCGYNNNRKEIEYRTVFDSDNGMIETGKKVSGI